MGEHLKVVVCGGRSFDDADFIFGKLDRLHAEYAFDTVIEGDARGVDRIAGAWARSRKCQSGRVPCRLEERRMPRRSHSQ